eukprot:4685051-Pyramimonas_sp.AAC.1
MDAIAVMAGAASSLDTVLFGIAVVYTAPVIRPRPSQAFGSRNLPRQHVRGDLGGTCQVDATCGNTATTNIGRCAWRRMSWRCSVA